VDEITLHIDYATHEQLMECIRLIGEEVIPEVRRLTKRPALALRLPTETLRAGHVS